MYQIKCRKCRTLVTQDKLKEKRILNGHGIPLGQDNNSCIINENIVYLNEDFLPDWIKLKIEEVNWTKSRLNCPHCDSRIGAFDFISGTQCVCNKNVLPPVHIIKSKVDIVKIVNENID